MMYFPSLSLHFTVIQFEYNYIRSHCLFNLNRANAILNGNFMLIVSGSLIR